MAFKDTNWIQPRPPRGPSFMWGLDILLQLHRHVQDCFECSMNLNPTWILSHHCLVFESMHGRSLESYACIYEANPFASPSISQPLNPSEVLDIISWRKVHITPSHVLLCILLIGFMVQYLIDRKCQITVQS